MSEQQLNVNAEAVSKRTSWTLRGVITGAGLLLALFGFWSVTALSSTALRNDGDNTLAMTWYIASLAAIVGVVALGGVLVKMDRGIRQQNLRAIGIVLVAVLITLLAIAYGDGFEAVLGLLGAIVGYLFGKDSSSNDGPGSSDKNTTPETPGTAKTPETGTTPDTTEGAPAPGTDESAGDRR